MKLNKYQILNIITLTLGLIICVFGFSKIIYYGSQRSLYIIDYVDLNNYAFCLLATILLFVFATIYNKKKKLKILTIIFYCINILIFIAYSKNYITQAYYVFTSELWLPNNVDYFTSLFESIIGTLFSLYLIIVFIIEIKNKYFKKN